MILKVISGSEQENSIWENLFTETQRFVDNSYEHYAKILDMKISEDMKFLREIKP